MSVNQELRSDLRAWHQQPNETDTAYRAFRAFLAFPPEDRQVVETYRQVKKRPEAKQANGVWNRWAKINRWRERARAFDEDRRIEQEKAEVAELRKWAAKKEQRQLRARFQFQELGEELIKKAFQMLKYPLVEQMTKDGQSLIVPVRWTLDTVRGLVQSAKELLSIANEMSQEHKELVIKHEIQELAKETGLSPEDLEREFDKMTSDRAGAN